jgi:hypothetical protein
MSFIVCAEPLILFPGFDSYKNTFVDKRFQRFACPRIRKGSGNHN